MPATHFFANNLEEAGLDPKKVLALSSLVASYAI